MKALKTKTARPRVIRPARVRKSSSHGRATTPVALPEPKSVPVAVKAVKPVHAPEPSAPHQDKDAFQLYLREVGETPLLKPADEIVLAKRIKRGDKAAREQMIKANLRLVVKIARDYEGYGTPLLDLINEGNIGLMKAVERFDPRKGAKLSTYAAWWIKQAIKRALANQSKTIRLPVHVVDKLFHLRQVESRLQEELGREATDDELAAELDTTATRIRRWRTAAMKPTSLDAPIGEDADDGKSVADVVKDDKAGTPYDQLEGKTNTELIHQIITTLDEREQAILRFRFGLDGDPTQTLEEIGVKFGVTRERIRQIQEHALKKLRRRIEELDTMQFAA